MADRTCGGFQAAIWQKGSFFIKASQDFGIYLSTTLAYLVKVNWESDTMAHQNSFVYPRRPPWKKKKKKKQSTSDLVRKAQKCISLWYSLSYHIYMQTTIITVAVYLNINILLPVCHKKNKIKKKSLFFRKSS